MNPADAWVHAYRRRHYGSHVTAWRVVLVAYVLLSAWMTLRTWYG